MALDKDSSFELIKELGCGGFASTYQTRVINPKFLKQWRCEEIVALKMPRDEDGSIALGNEAGLNLTIKNLCSIRELSYFCEVYGTYPFNSHYGSKNVMVMKYMPEGNLRAKIEKNPLSVEMAITYIKDILQGLSIMHRIGIVHRDIKPENILFMDGKPRICDMGIGKVLHSNEYAKSIVGTLYYISPELLMGEKGATFNTDIWSLGIMFHEMLYGCLPFGITEEYAQGQIITAIISNGDINSPERNDIPEEIVGILHRSLVKDNKKRYLTAQEMIEDIEKFEIKNIKETEEYKKFVEKRNNKEYDSAISCLENLIKKYPKSPDLYIDLCRVLHSHSGIKKALDILNTGIEEIPDCGNLYFEAGILLNHTHENRKTIEYLQNSIKLGISDRKNLIIAKTLIKKLNETKS